MRQIPLTINPTKRTCHTIQLLFSLHLLQSQRLLVLCGDGFALCLPIPRSGVGARLFFGLGCFLVCVGMGQAWGACCMGWDGVRRHVGLCVGVGLKKIHYTPNDGLSSFLGLDRFSAS